MKSMFLLIALLLLFSASTVISKDVTTPKIEPSFRIYLVDQEINILDKAISKRIDEIKLSKEPVISEKDIKTYHWKSHTIELTKEGAERFKKMIVYGKPEGEDVQRKDLWSKGMNKAFVVIVNDKRAYLGRTTSMLSSFIGSFPSIDISWLDPDKAMIVNDANMPENSIRIDRIMKDGEEDVRGQEWIRDALEELKLLK